MVSGGSVTGMTAGRSRTSRYLFSLPEWPGSQDIACLWRKQHDTGTGFCGSNGMWFFSTVLCLLTILCCVAGLVNALAVRREFKRLREQEYHARVRAATGERILRERYEKFRRRRER